MYIVEACVCVFICVRCIYVLYIRLVCKALRALREKGRYIHVSYYYYYYYYYCVSVYRSTYLLVTYCPADDHSRQVIKRLRTDFPVDLP